MHRTHGSKTFSVASCEAFRGCSPRELRAIERLGTEIATAAGTRLCSEDATQPQFVVVLDGSVEICRSGELVGTIGSGGCFGHAPLLADSVTERVTAIAAAPSYLLVFARHEFRALLDAAPSLAIRLQREVAEAVPVGAPQTAALTRAQRSAFATA